MNDSLGLRYVALTLTDDEPLWAKMARVYPDICRELNRHQEGHDGHTRNGIQYGRAPLASTEEGTAKTVVHAGAAFFANAAPETTAPGEEDSEADAVEARAGGADCARASGEGC